MNSLIEVKNLIYEIRGYKVMLDSDLAELYEVPTKRLNEAVKRNIARFPKHYMFQLNSDEYQILRSQSATSNKVRGGRRYMPYVFTEQGVAMLSSVLTSEKAIQINCAKFYASVYKSSFSALIRRIINVYSAQTASINAKHFTNNLTK